MSTALCWCGCGLRVTPPTGHNPPNDYRDHHARRKLTADDLVEIRQSRASGRALAGLYDVSPQTISNVRRGMFYGDVQTNESA